MTRLMHRLLKRYGRPVTLVQGEQRKSLFAVLQSATSVSQHAMRRQMGDLGALPQGQYVYIGTEQLPRESYLLRDGQVFLPKQCEPFAVGGKILYYWGLAAWGGTEEQWL